MLNNPINWLKNQLKSYLITYHDYPTEKYLDDFVNVFIKDFINAIEQIFCYGFLLYLSLFGLSMFIPSIQNIFWLGTMKISYIFAIIFTLGLTILLVKQSVIWFCGVKNK